MFMAPQEEGGQVLGQGQLSLDLRAKREDSQCSGCTSWQKISLGWRLGGLELDGGEDQTWEG